MNINAYSMTIANVISDFLTEDDWHFTFDEERGLFRFGVNLSGRIKSVNYIVDVHEDEYIVYAISPIGADADDRTMMAEMADFFCRANYGLKNGNFELDMNDGEIRYKTYIDCEGITPSAEVVHNSVYCPAAMYRRYSAGIVDIIFGGATAKGAIAKCEKSPAEELRALLGEDSDGDADVDALIARLAARLGMDEGEGGSDRDTTEYYDRDDRGTELSTDFFGTEADVS